MTADRPLVEPRVAIVHDWLYGGGAELVVEQLHKLYPDAPIFTSYCTNAWRERLDNKVVTGWLQHFGKARRFLTVFRTWWFSSLDLSKYDIVISSTGNGEAKNIRTSKNTLHVCYCHAPTHYYWRHYRSYVEQPGFGLANCVVRLVLRAFIRPLRWWDYRAAQRPDHFIANSTHTQEDIKRFYDRDSVVVHPPVYLERFGKQPTDQPREGFISSGRLVPYKRNDIIIAACRKLALPLTIIGDGPDATRLRRRAGPTIRFLGKAPDGVVEAELARAKAFLLAACEDFGVTPVEALASGTPILAYKAGGALDYVIAGKTGDFFETQDEESLMNAMLRFDSKAYDPEELRAFAANFSSERFRSRMREMIRAYWVARNR